MQLDAHYYAVLAFARGCGYKKESAHTIAYASQFVDDAKINHILTDEKHPNIEGAEVDENGTHFLNMATCHSYLRFKTMNYSAMTNNTCAFHFVPGCKGNNIPRKFRCLEDNEVIKGILEEVLEDTEDNHLEKLGMALHAYADTFSHQGFAGIPCKVNDIIEPKLKKPIVSGTRIFNNTIRVFLRKQLRKYDYAIPPYGHGQALEFPDMAHAEWFYRYDGTENLLAIDQDDHDQFKDCPVDNVERFKRAFENIKGYLARFLDRHERHRDEEMFPDGILKFDKFNVLEEALVKNVIIKSMKVNHWQDVLTDPKNSLFSKTDKDLLVVYDENKWLEDAFDNYEEKKFHHRSVSGVRLDKNFEESHWYKYYRAVKWYKPKFYAHCRANGLDIPNDYLKEETVIDDAMAA